MTHYNSKTTPTNNIDYTCHIKAVELHHATTYQWFRGHTHTHKHTHTHTHTNTDVHNFKKPGMCQPVMCAWFSKSHRSQPKSKLAPYKQLLK